MARKPRIHYPGAIYHVIARGNNRGLVFKEDKDRYKYQQFMAKYLDKCSVQLFCYVLMENHVHLLVQVGQNPLALMMQGIQQSYTQYFNRKYEHVGHVFQQRYKALLCTDDSYLITLLCYIHQNPLRAGEPEGINFRWSSHNAYLGKAQSLVNVGFILDQLHHDRRQAIAAYQSIVGSKINDPDMINPIMPIVQRDQIMLKNPLQPDPMSPLGWERLVSLIAEEYGIEEETLISPCRVRKVVAARNRLIFEAINLNLCSRSELARWLNMDPSRISRVLYQYLKEKGEIRRISQ